MIGKILEWVKANLAFYVLVLLMAGSYFVPVYVGFYKTVNVFTVFGLIPMALAIIWARPMSMKDLFVHTIYSLGFGFIITINVIYDPTRIDLLAAMVIPMIILGLTRLFDGVQ